MAADCNELGRQPVACEEVDMPLARPLGASFAREMSFRPLLAHLEMCAAKVRHEQWCARFRQSMDILCLGCVCKHLLEHRWLEIICQVDAVVSSGKLLQ